MLLELNMSMTPTNTIDVANSSIWNTLIPSHPDLLDGIDDSDDIFMMMIYHQYQSKVRKPNIHVDFKPFNFLVQQHENIEPTEGNTSNYILFGFGLNGILFGLK
jgi:hypothetical protein